MKTNGRLRVIFLSTYPPRECGIATFTQDIVEEMRKFGKMTPRVMAISNQELKYGPDVLSHFKQNSRFSHLAAAELINKAGADLVMVEHEYGIYGGRDGEYLLDLLERLQVPYMVTCHTVRQQPTREQRDILAEVCYFSRGVVVMSERSGMLLRDMYDVDPHKILHLPHGVPAIPTGSRAQLKAEKGYTGRTVVSTFGLLSPGKGLEYGIGAIARAARRRRDILYLILGQTHPVVRRASGEAYREQLEQLVDKYGIRDNVTFVNEYLDKADILRYLTLSDVYLTPYLGREQAVSGTLAYAIGCGRVVVSTPYAYAREMLAGGRGVLAEFEDEASLADGILQVVEDEPLKAQMEQHTWALGRDMAWPQVARRYEAAFLRAAAADVREVVS